MELTNRYIYAVTKNLRKEQRQDISNELRSLIEDMLEEQAGSHLSTEEKLENILLQLGHPKELANKYRGQKRYLIGPDIFDYYMSVLKLVIVVVSTVFLATFVIETILDPTTILKNFINMIISALTALPVAFGWTTFGFAIGQLNGSFKGKQFNNDKWRPSDLEPIPNERKVIKSGEAIAGIVFYVIIMVFLSLSSEYFGVWIFNDKSLKVIPFLNEQTYSTYLLFIIYIFGFGILKESLKLVIGEWTAQLAILTTILNVISTIGIIFIIKGPAFWNPNFVDNLVAERLIMPGTDAFNVITTLWNQITMWIVVIMIVGLLWDAINGFIKSRKS